MESSLSTPVIGGGKKMGLAQPLVDGLSVTSVLIIAALGFAITCGVMNIINMAHGELVMIGAYTTYLVTTVSDLPFFIAIIVSFIVSAIIGLIMEKLVVKHLYGRPLETLLATVGISIVLQQLVKITFGTGGKSISNPISGSMEIGSVIVPYYRLFIIVFAIVLIILTVLLMFKTNFGTQLRTVSQNRQMSEVLGINTSRIDSLTFAFGSGLAGIAGAILAPIYTVSPTMGAGYLMDAFMVVVLGGVGSITGTALGSFVVGEADQIISTFSTEIVANIIVFSLIIIVIRYKPEGLLKRERR